MPFKSNAQRKFFHTKTASQKGITPDVVDEFDQASKGMKLPETVDPTPAPLQPSAKSHFRRQ